jgi:hypothetical protein
LHEETLARECIRAAIHLMTILTDMVKSVRVSTAGSVELMEQLANNFLARLTFMEMLTFPRCEFNDAFGEIPQPVVFDMIHKSDLRPCASDLCIGRTSGIL